MSKKKLKNVRCVEINCNECPLEHIPCASFIGMATPFGHAYKKMKEVIELLEKDLEKEVEVVE